MSHCIILTLIFNSVLIRNYYNLRSPNHTIIIYHSIIIRTTVVRAVWNFAEFSTDR